MIERLVLSAVALGLGLGPIAAMGRQENPLPAPQPLVQNATRAHEAVRVLDTVQANRRAIENSSGRFAILAQANLSEPEETLASDTAEEEALNSDMRSAS